MSENVRNMFADIAGKYDLLNDVLSLGIHKSWRRKAVELSRVRANNLVLDVAAGTGDFSFEFYDKDANVIGTDFCEEMLVVAREKAQIKHAPIKFQVADAMNLPFDDNMFDVVSIGFGIRNVDDVRVAIKDMTRVLKPGGRLVILEFGQPEGMFKYIYDFYSKKIMPKIGAMLAKSESAYTYLPETAAKFPCRDEFLKIANDSTVFTKTKYYELSFGIAYIYVLEK